MQTVTNRVGQLVNVTDADVQTLRMVVENIRSCGGGTQCERKVARRELRRRGYAWYACCGDTQMEVRFLHEDNAKQDETVWSRACVSWGSANDRITRNCP